MQRAPAAASVSSTASLAFAASGEHHVRVAERRVGRELGAEQRPRCRGRRGRRARASRARPCCRGRDADAPRRARSVGPTSRAAAARRLDAAPRREHEPVRVRERALELRAQLARVDRFRADARQHDGLGAVLREPFGPFRAILLAAREQDPPARERFGGRGHLDPPSVASLAHSSAPSFVGSGPRTRAARTRPARSCMPSSSCSAPGRRPASCSPCTK